ncbi:MAG: hypothetical protein UR27_C0010G0064 [Candidatus Peregrinibacteria bacterium GW2011_GWA2_33_10]|nr:MAG: hypothetical protein UR27_C0010G0064 [Candidatus Peregrinibacteria bacterium GW2011_GWA2_33_10]KKP41252.1 MAG: hypothetical protein UR30_C0001G0099 [Candidatus Peregrinibacteria bacterium GW2011_GWC2_33_13]
MSDQKYNPLFDPKNQEVFNDYVVPKDLVNNPPIDPDEFNDEDQKFLKHILKLIEDKTIDLMTPSTLYNDKVYDELSPEGKTKVEFEAANLLAKIRQIKSLYDGGFERSYQLENLIRSVRLSKERIEEIRGDVFII